MLRIAKIVARPAKIVLRIANLVLRIEKIMLRIANFVLRIGKIVLRIANIVDAGPIMQKRPGFLWETGKKGISSLS